MDANRPSEFTVRMDADQPDMSVKVPLPSLVSRVGPGESIV